MESGPAPVYRLCQSKTGVAPRTDISAFSRIRGFNVGTIQADFWRESYDGRGALPGNPNDLRPGLSGALAGAARPSRADDHADAQG